MDDCWRMGRDVDAVQLVAYTIFIWRFIVSVLCFNCTQFLNWTNQSLVVVYCVRVSVCVYGLRESNAKELDVCRKIPHGKENNNNFARKKKYIMNQICSKLLKTVKNGRNVAIGFDSITRYFLRLHSHHHHLHLSSSARSVQEWWMQMVLLIRINPQSRHVPFNVSFFWGWFFSTKINTQKTNYTFFGFSLEKKKKQYYKKKVAGSISSMDFAYHTVFMRLVFSFSVFFFSVIVNFSTRPRIHYYAE